MADDLSPAATRLRDALVALYLDNHGGSEDGLLQAAAVEVSLGLRKRCSPNAFVPEVLKAARAVHRERLFRDRCRIGTAEEARQAVADADEEYARAAERAKGFKL